MVKKQRGKTAPAPKPAAAESFGSPLDSSDDEAPEEVTFQASKASALQSLKRALDTARREKELLKEKRRRRQELFQEQKKRKLLPTDVLEEIDAASPEKKKRQQQQQACEERAEQPEDDEDEDEEGERSAKEDEGQNKMPNVRSLKGNYTVQTVKERALASSQQQVALDFLQSRLYGPGSCRTTSNELLSLQNKRGRKKSAAVQFVNKGWASEHKAKAEKLKKRWIHKQQVPSG
ncbi:nucleolar protein 7 isoform X2 [Myripristis murdjan]|uniref:nucleolar protein 7 isoform X2 n=1 Tax=Myripristis murdjan TaxID=586833 RepID=UPI0011760B65|nr:nucleolar protein 7 isoform X2 [Myripristis murdjan]